MFHSFHFIYILLKIEHVLYGLCRAKYSTLVYIDHSANLKKVTDFCVVLFFLLCHVINSCKYKKYYCYIVTSTCLGRCSSDNQEVAVLFISLRHDLRWTDMYNII